MFLVVHSPALTKKRGSQNTKCRKRRLILIINYKICREEKNLLLTLLMALSHQSTLRMMVYNKENSTMI